MNLLFENPSMDMAYRYSYVYKTVLLTVFFVTLFPLCALISLVGMIFSYIIEKVKLINYFAQNELLSKSIFNAFDSRYFNVI